mgnify:CR=1 FL=1
MVGGELTMEDLALRYNAVSGFYGAPVQMIANGGIPVLLPKDCMDDNYDCRFERTFTSFAQTSAP